MYKSCIKCGLSIPIDSFPVRSDSPGKKRKECRGCMAANSRKYYLKSIKKISRQVRLEQLRILQEEIETLEQTHKYGKAARKSEEEAFLIMLINAEYPDIFI